MRLSALLVLAVALLFAGQAKADILSSSQEFSVATDAESSGHTTGTHFHHSSGYPGGAKFPSGYVDVGSYDGPGVTGFWEEARGMAEFDLSSESSVSAVNLIFDVSDDGGWGINADGDEEAGIRSAFDGEITIWAYYGNGAENTGDYSVSTFGSSVGTFDTDDLSVGGFVSYDVTSWFNTVANSSTYDYLGFRLQVSTWDVAAQRDAGTAWTFDNFELDTDPDSAGTGPVVPEPATLALMGLGTLGLAAARRRRRA